MIHLALSPVFSGTAKNMFSLNKFIGAVHRLWEHTARSFKRAIHRKSFRAYPSVGVSVPFAKYTAKPGIKKMECRSYRILHEERRQFSLHRTARLQ